MRRVTPDNVSMPLYILRGKRADKGYKTGSNKGVERGEDEQWRKISGQKSALKCTLSSSTFITYKIMLDPSWNIAYAKVRCEAFSLVDILRCACFFTGPDGFPKPGRRRLDDIGKKLFYTSADAAALAKSMTEKYERTWGWVGPPDIPMAKPWEKILDGAQNCAKEDK